MIYHALGCSHDERYVIIYIFRLVSWRLWHISEAYLGTIGTWLRYILDIVEHA